MKSENRCGICGFKGEDCHCFEGRWWICPLIALILGAIMMILGLAHAAPAQDARRSINQRLEIKIEKIEAENRLLKRQIAALRRLCIKAGISPEREIKEALKSKPASRGRPPTIKPQYAAIGELSLGMIVEFPNQYNAWVESVQKDKIIISLHRKGLNIGASAPDGASDEARELANARIREYIKTVSENAERVAIKGISVKGITTDKRLDLHGKFKVAGTEKYGSKTIFVMEAIK